MQMRPWHEGPFIFIVLTAEGVETLEFRKICRKKILKTKQITTQQKKKNNIK